MQPLNQMGNGFPVGFVGRVAIRKSFGDIFNLFLCFGLFLIYLQIQLGIQFVGELLLLCRLELIPKLVVLLLESFSGQL